MVALVAVGAAWRLVSVVVEPVVAVVVAFVALEALVHDAPVPVAMVQVAMEAARACC